MEIIRRNKKVCKKCKNFKYVGRDRKIAYCELDGKRSKQGFLPQSVGKFYRHWNLCHAPEECLYTLELVVLSKHNEMILKEGNKEVN